MASKNKEEKLDKIFSALSDTTRRKILEELSSAPSTVSTLAEPFNMTLAAVLKHLKILEEAGLVVMDKEGRVRRCLFNPEPLSHATEWIVSQESHWQRGLKSLKNMFEK